METIGSSGIVVEISHYGEIKLDNGRHFIYLSADTFEILKEMVEQERLAREASAKVKTFCIFQGPQEAERPDTHARHGGEEG